MWAEGEEVIISFTVSAKLVIAWARVLRLMLMKWPRSVLLTPHHFSCIFHNHTDS